MWGLHFLSPYLGLKKHYISKVQRELEQRFAENCVGMLLSNFSYPSKNGYNYFREIKGLGARKKYVCFFLAWAVSVCWTVMLPGLKSMVKVFLCAVHYSWIVNCCSSLALCFPSATTTLSSVSFSLCPVEFNHRLEVTIVLLLQGTFRLFWVNQEI